MWLSLIIVNSLVTGSIYAILAAGFSLIFSVARMANFAHTGLYMLCGYIIYIFANMLGWNLVPSAIVAIAVIVFLAMAYYHFVLDRVNEQHLAVMILTLALAMLIQSILLIFFRSDQRSIAPFIDAFIEVLGVRVSYQHIFTFTVCALVLVGLWFLLSKTKLGHAIRAVSQDSEMANAMGINVGIILLVTVGISAVLAGIAALMVTPLFGIEPYMWLNSLVIVVAAAVLGGLGSIKGSVIAAFILGFAEILTVTLVPQGGWLRGLVSMLAMLLILLFRPEGLFGIIFEEERL